MYPLKNLRRRSARTVLTITGVSLAITLAIIMFSISEGIRESTDEIIEGSGIDLLVMKEGGDIFFGGAELDHGRALAENINMGKLFSLSQFYKQYLLDGSIDAALRKAFENNDLSLSNDATISNVDATHWDINNDAKEISIVDTGTQLDIYDTSIAQKIKGTYPVQRERMYLSANKTSLGDEIPKVTSILSTGSTREVSENFGVARVIKGDYLPTPGDPFYQDNTYYGGVASENFTHEILLNSILAEYLEVNIGDRVYLSQELPTTRVDFGHWLSNATWFRVEGILAQSFEDEGEMSATLHLSELQYIADKSDQDRIDTIIVDLYNPADAKEVKQFLMNDFEDKDKISAYTQNDIREQIERFTSIFRGFSEMVAGITILVAFLFISTVIMISVKERTGELCALRAIGFSRFSIFKLVLAESVLICLIGFMIGLILGAVGSEIINIYAENIATGLPEGFKIAKITPLLLFKATGSITLIGVLVGLIPAYWASRLNIIEALKSE